jgi:hypothetical protein
MSRVLGRERDEVSRDRPRLALAGSGNPVMPEYLRGTNLMHRHRHVHEGVWHEHEHPGVVHTYAHDTPPAASAG